MQKKQSRKLCAVLWFMIIAILIAAVLIPTYRLDKSFDGEFIAYGKTYPATAELSVTYHRDPFIGEYKNEGKLRFITDLEDDIAQYYGYLYFYPGWLDHVLWNPRFYEVSASGWRDRFTGFVHLHGFVDSDAKTLLLHDSKDSYSFAGKACDEDEAAEIFDYLASWYGLAEEGFTENPFSHEPLIDRETAHATRTATPLVELLKQVVRDFFSDCWEYLLIGVVALVALALSYLYPQIYLNKWILDALHEDRSGAKRYLRHSRICFTAMGLAVPLFACLAYFVEFSTPWYRLTSGICYLIGLIATIIALLAVLHRRVWIPITTQP